MDFSSKFVIKIIQFARSTLKILLKKFKREKNVFMTIIFYPFYLK